LHSLRTASFPPADSKATPIERCMSRCPHCT
jgi:hypothetical protein